MLKYTPCMRLWFCCRVDLSLPLNHSWVMCSPYCWIARAMVMLPCTSMQLTTMFAPACFMRWTSVATVVPG